jgi:hypothetical protein
MKKNYKLTKKSIKLSKKIKKTNKKTESINNNIFKKINLNLKKELTDVYSNIKFNKNTYIYLINSLINKERRHIHNKYKTNLVIININKNLNNILSKTKFIFYNKNQIPRDSRIIILTKYMINLCKWIDINYKNEKIDTCILFWISDRFIYEIENIDKLSTDERNARRDIIYKAREIAGWFVGIDVDLDDLEVDDE